MSVSASAAGRGEVDGQDPDGLHGVGVHRDAVLVGDGGQLARPGSPCRPRCSPTSPTPAPPARVRRRARRAASPGAPGPARRRAAARPARPRARRATRPTSSTAWCSIAETSTRVRRGSAARRAQYRPLTARLSLSVPPVVSTTSDGRAPTAAAMRSRDSSTSRRERRPAECSDDALPVARAPRPSPRRPRAASAWWRRDRGRSSVKVRSRIPRRPVGCAGVIQGRRRGTAGPHRLERCPRPRGSSRHPQLTGIAVTMTLSR